MSRSYKKHPWAGDNKNSFMKNYANRRLRRKLKNPEFSVNNKNYKKVTETYYICDYWWYSPWEDYWNHCISNWLRWGYKYDSYPNKDKEYQNWHKWYKRK